MSIDLDVVIIGGGVQGLLVLNALTEQGYTCVLVNDGPLGGGQTLHSHGFLFTGFGQLGDELPRASTEVVQPYLRRHGIQPTGEWALMPPPDSPALDMLPPTSLPSGFSDSLAGKVVRIPDRNFPKRPLVEALSRGHLDRILRGRAALALEGQRVRKVMVRLAAGDEISLQTRLVVVAAGCASKSMVESLVGPTAQTEQVKHRRVHMICVRAPHGSLPALSLAAPRLGLMLAAHEQTDTVTWYVTPLEFDGESYDDVPHDAAGDIDREIVGRGFQTLLALYPPLLGVESLQLGCYAGYRQDIGDQPGIPMCEMTEGTTNVLLALPSGNVAAWLNAARIVEIASDLVDPSGAQLQLPEGGTGVEVGCAVEDRPDFCWLALDEWVLQYMSGWPMVA